MTDAFRTTSPWQARLDVVRRRRTLFLSVVIGTFLTATAFVVGLPHLYRAKATLLVRDPGALSLIQSDDRGEVNGRLQAIKQEALSRSRLVDLIRQFRLYGYGPADDVPEAAVVRMQRDVRADVTTTDQSPNGPSAVAFTLSYVGTDPKTAADVTNALASFYVAQNDQMRVEQASVATTLLGEQLEEAHRRLQAQEAQIRGYVSSNVGALPQQVDSNLAAVARLDGQMRLNNTEQMRLLERRQALQNQIAEAGTRVPAADDTDPQARLARMKADLTGLKNRFSAEHPDVRAKEAEIQSLQREIGSAPVRPAARGSSPAEAATQSLKEVESELTRLDAENEQLKSTISSFQQRVDRGASRVPMVDALMRDYQSTRDQYDAAQKRFNEAQLARRAEQGPGTREFKILDPAIVPTTSTGPSAAVLVTLAALLALAVGVLVLIVADRFDTTFHSIDELRAFTSLPILASIPVLAAEPRRATETLRAAALASATTVAIVGVALSAFHVAHRCEQVVRVLSRVG